MSKFFEKVIRPTLFRLDAERAHELGIKALELGLAQSRASQRRRKSRSSERHLDRSGVLDFEFENPLGIAAGFDKNAIVVDQLAALGFGFVEVGTVTYRAAAGKPKAATCSACRTTRL